MCCQHKISQLPVRHPVKYGYLKLLAFKRYRLFFLYSTHVVVKFRNYCLNNGFQLPYTKIMPLNRSSQLFEHSPYAPT